MKKFLVIDDSDDRKNQYCRVFNFLELEFAFTKNEFLEKIKQKYDGYIVDIIYDEQKFEDYSFKQILNGIPPKKPLFVISSQWSNAMDTMKMKSLRETGKYNDVLGYLSWKSINGINQEEYVRDFAKEQLAHYFDMAFGAFDQNQNITILQISDIEFGNPEQIKNIRTEKEKLINQVKNELVNLGTNDSKVDFICICGDIAYTGEKEQYDAAKGWLIELGKELLVNANFENMLIVPGNHDYSFNASAGNYFYSSYNKNLKTIEYFARDNNSDLKYHEHAMYNFAKFVYELNGEKSYLLNPYRPIIKRTYENYGFNFILLNPIRTNFEKKFVLGLTDSDTEYLIKFSQNMDKDVCNIILSHFAPEKYDMIDPSADTTNRDIKSVANALNIKGWFYGHAHGDEIIDDRKVGDYKVLTSRTQSLMLENGQRCYGASNGFTLFKMSRTNGKVTSISYYDKKKQDEISYDNLGAY